ncbi:hypothetical protein CDL15_Pgr007415 [Punica granatum]|uniref:Uncharacterized protein n=1 Tax=Punica granatum TaxID=22663 RepID=A0A218X8V1_PUNGR|nr:hypothetical protein CDL15_Pgr007415 [Punica granatum]
MAMNNEELYPVGNQEPSQLPFPRPGETKAPGVVTTRDYDRNMDACRCVDYGDDGSATWPRSAPRSTSRRTTPSAFTPSARAVVCQTPLFNVASLLCADNESIRTIILVAVILHRSNVWSVSLMERVRRQAINAEALVMTDLGF